MSTQTETRCRDCEDDAPYVILCPLHTAAPALLEALEGFINVRHEPDGTKAIKIMEDTYALALKAVANARGEN